MSSSRRLTHRLILIAGLVGSAAFVSGCSFSPVYGTGSTAEQSLQLAYAKPDTRLEQVVYQELQLRLGSDAAVGAPLVSVDVSIRRRVLTRSATDDPMPVHESTATGTVTITRDGEIVESFKRSASATYSSSPQVLANQEGLIEADERAARALAESIRLTLIGQFGGANRS